jgi:hypothetical protein
MEYVGTYFFVAILSILWPNGIFYGYLVHFVVIWYFFPVWVCSEKKSGNPDRHSENYSFWPRPQTSKASAKNVCFWFHICPYANSLIKQEQAFALWLSEA